MFVNLCSRSINDILSLPNDSIYPFIEFISMNRRAGPKLCARPDAVFRRKSVLSIPSSDFDDGTSTRRRTTRINYI